MVFDGSQNLHVKMEFTSKGTVQNEVSWWNYEKPAMDLSRRLVAKTSNINGQTELIVGRFAETKTSKQLNISHETFKMDVTDPLMGVTVTQGYIIIRHMIVKFLNGELQFQNEWEIQRNL